MLSALQQLVECFSLKDELFALRCWGVRAQDVVDVVDVGDDVVVGDGCSLLGTSL